MDPVRNNLVQVGDMLVDAPALVGLSHRCDPLLCRESGSCCGRYDLWIGAEERDRLFQFEKQITRLCSGNRKKSIQENVRQIAPRTYSVEKGADGLCAFTCRGAGGEVLCALHRLALERGIPPERLKPRPCILWPLSTTSSSPAVLSVQEGVLRFPCNATRQNTEEPVLDPGVADIVSACFGADFLEELRARLSEWDPGEPLST